MAVTECEWFAAVTNAFQVLVGALSGYVPMQRADEALGSIREPRPQVERLFLQGRITDLLADIALTGVPVARDDVRERILAAWPSIRHHAAPISVLRCALESPLRVVATEESHIADRIRDVIERRYTERLLLKDIVRELGVSKSTASRCFGHVYRSTIHQRLVLVRAKHGLILVTQGAKIEAAALAVGFRSKKDFYRAVQKLVGCTPAQFRASNHP